MRLLEHPQHIERYVPALDGVRAAAVMLVITYHFGIFRFGWTGVGLFFVLSGYLITTILLEQRGQNFGAYLGRFYWRRALRILPIYFGFLLSVMAIWLATGYPTGAGKQFPWLATFTFNIYMALSHRAGLEQIFHHLWSISNEEQFYLLWPLLVWILGRRWTGWLAAMLIVSGPVIRLLEPSMVESLGLQADVAGRFIYYFPVGHFDAFAIGGLLAAFTTAPWRRNALLWGLLLCIPATIIVLRVIALYVAGITSEIPIHLGFPMSSTEDGFHIWGYSAAYICFGGVMILVLWGSERLWIRRIADWGPTRFIGQISYGMYIYHWPLLLVLEKFWPLSENLGIRLLQFKLYMIALVIGSWASHRFFESWFLRQKDRFFAAKA